MKKSQPWKKKASPFARKKAYSKPQVVVAQPVQKVAGTCISNPIAKNVAGQPNSFGGTCTPPNLFS